jgi:polar amino acid transport system permease protein
MLIRNIPPVVFVFVFVFFIASQIMPVLGSVTGCAPPHHRAMVDFDPVRPAEADRQLFPGPHLPVGVLGRVRHRDRAGGHRVRSPDQIEAGDSLGMSRLDVVRFIVLPQALRNVLPPLAGQFIS